MDTKPGLKPEKISTGAISKVSVILLGQDMALYVAKSLTFLVGELQLEWLCPGC